MKKDVTKKKADLEVILNKHKKRLSGRPNGERANLEGANLGDIYLGGTNLEGVKYNGRTGFYALQCPEAGSFTGFKKASGYIIELLIPKDAKRSSATSRKCRCSSHYDVIGKIWPNPFVYNHTGHTWEAFKAALETPERSVGGWSGTVKSNDTAKKTASGP